VAALIEEGSSRQGKAEADEEDEEDQEDQHPPRRAGEEREGHDDGGEEKDGDEDEEHGAGEDTPVSLDDVAKAVGLSKTELNAVEVRVGPDKLTLGELKAKLPEVARLAHDRLEFEERKTATELEQIDAHRQIMALVDTLGPESIPPRLMRQLQAQHLQTRAREAEMLTKARPQWSDAKYSSAEKEAMVKVGNRYGFSPAELAAIVDHRQVLLLQDFTHAIARIEASKAAARKVEGGSDKPLKQETQRVANGQRDTHGTSKNAQLSKRIAHLIERG
jgi:hypothetical protein